MKSKLLIIALFASSITLFAQKKEKDKVLANKTYTVEFTETGAKKPKPVSDEISFKSNKLNSKFMMTEHHFQASDYTVSVDSTSDPKTITFSSNAANPDKETLKWDGTITEDAIEGTATITTKKGKEVQYSFTGNLKEKPGKK
jgi:hypothetical protein